MSPVSFNLLDLKISGFFRCDDCLKFLAANNRYWNNVALK
jgi:hypothetical protein